ncbi:MAG: IS21 family transposase [Verrucomicrobia bacterium]|nr:IS21 family transposase [Verrucomicrobiota bacterium]
MREEAAVPSLLGDQRRDVMMAPDDVSAMLQLKALGWGSKRIAAELGCSRNTVRQWLARGDWRPCKSASRSKKLDNLYEWLRERFRQHAGNADVVRQELAREKNITVSLRTVERAVAPLRRELIAAARATVRFETQPGEQLQIDFGERRVEIDGVSVKVFLFVATLGYSRRLHVRAYGHEKQDSWFDGMESAFRAFGGVPREVLLDNAKALILHHDPASREVVLHPRLHAFAHHWRFRIRACAPYRARTKGKDERGVGYVKSNAIAGRRFASWSELEAHLENWTREVADMRVHGTTGETPIERFSRDEAKALRPLTGTPPFISARDLVRRVGADCAIEVDGNAYSVPWQLIGERVRVTVGGGSVRVLHAGREVAVHFELRGRHGRVTNDSHLVGIAGTPGKPVRTATVSDIGIAQAPPALLRPLAEYEAAIGGGF